MDTVWQMNKISLLRLHMKPNGFIRSRFEPR